jgi:hypothetical protein
LHLFRNDLSVNIVYWWEWRYGTRYIAATLGERLGRSPWVAAMNLVP